MAVICIVVMLLARAGGVRCVAADSLDLAWRVRGNDTGRLHAGLPPVHSPSVNNHCLGWLPDNLSFSRRRLLIGLPHSPLQVTPSLRVSRPWMPRVSSPDHPSLLQAAMITPKEDRWLTLLPAWDFGRVRCAHLHDLCRCGGQVIRVPPPHKVLVPWWARRHSACRAATDCQPSRTPVHPGASWSRGMDAASFSLATKRRSRQVGFCRLRRHSQASCPTDGYIKICDKPR